MDTDNSEIGDEMDEDAIDEFMKEIDSEEKGGNQNDSDDDDNDNNNDSDSDSDGESSKPVSATAAAAMARIARKAQTEKRIAEDNLMDSSTSTNTNQNKKLLAKQRQENLENDPRLKRTIFISNVPVRMKPHHLTKWIENILVGETTASKANNSKESATHVSIIESVRYRSVAISDPKLPKKIAVRKGKFHENRDSCNAYVVFKNELVNQPPEQKEGEEESKEESKKSSSSSSSSSEETWIAKSVRELNGQEISFEEKSYKIRVDAAEKKKNTSKDMNKNDNALTLFVGNLPFSTNENDLYQHFASCAAPATASSASDDTSSSSSTAASTKTGVASIRLVRDSSTGMGKGFAFVLFHDQNSLRNALVGMRNIQFQGRSLRIMRAVENKKLHHQQLPNTNDKSGKGGSSAKKSSSSSSFTSQGKGGNDPQRKEGKGGAPESEGTE